MVFSDRQIEILGISLEIISKEGIQNFTMRQIAAEAGISEPAIYRHFPSKVAILEALLDQFAMRHQVLATKYLDGKDFAKAGQFMLAVLKNLSERPALSAIIFSEEIFRNEPVLREKIKAITESTQAAMVSHLNHFPIAKVLPVEQLVWMLMGSVRFLVARWRLSDFGFDLEKEGKPFIKNLMKLHANKENEK